jgi:hypothetical protein
MLSSPFPLRQSALNEYLQQSVQYLCENASRLNVTNKQQVILSTLLDNWNAAYTDCRLSKHTEPAVCALSLAIDAIQHWLLSIYDGLIKSLLTPIDLDTLKLTNYFSSQELTKAS